MRIHKIRLKNFRGFEDFEVEFSDQFNLLIGDNGSGKTALLEALSVAAGSLFLGFRQQTSVRHINEGDIRVVTYNREGIKTLEQQTPVELKAHGTVNEVKLSWTRTIGEPFGINTKEISHLGEDYEMSVQRGDTITLPLISYYSAGRLWLQKQEKPMEGLSPDSRLQGYDDYLDPASSGKTLFNWLRKRTLVELQKNEISSQLSAVKTALANCMENWETVYYDVNTDNLMAQLKDGRELPFDLLSDGQRNMLAMVADIAHRCAILNPHLAAEVTTKTPGIVLIDEIDLHLHPKWQRHVVDSLRKTFPEIQFFATTHSPFIIQSLKPGELIDLNETPPAEYSDRSLEDIVESIMGVEVPQKSLRYREMMDVAAKYYTLLKQKETTNPKELTNLKTKLDELLMPYSDEPAYQAFLKMEREAAGLGDS